MRAASYGQNRKMSSVDKFGVYLSWRMIKSVLGDIKKADTPYLDLGCGYNAGLLRKMLPRVSSAVGVDVSVSDEIKKLPKVKVCQGRIEEVTAQLESESFGLITMINVLEHLTNPAQALAECRRLLKKEGRLLINVPTWRGKFFLELSAFTFKLSPADEINDHKAYYDKKDLWPLLVKAGFLPGRIRMRCHKFGLNLFAVCRK